MVKFPVKTPPSRPIVLRGDGVSKPMTRGCERRCPHEASQPTPEAAVPLHGVRRFDSGH